MILVEWLSFSLNAGLCNQAEFLILLKIMDSGFRNDSVPNLFLNYETETGILCLFSVDKY